MAIAIRTIQYLHCTRHIGLRYHTDKCHPVMTFTDSDWAGCIDTRQSTSGRVTVMQGAAVMWKSARQKSIALSSCEAEMVAANLAARDARFIRRLHASIGKPIPHPTPLMIDSESAMTWIQGKARWSASRHIASSHFAIQDWRKRGHIIPIKVDTSRQYADMFTKNLPHNTFVMMRKMVLGRLNDLSTPYAPEWQPAVQQTDAPRTPTQV